MNTNLEVNFQKLTPIKDADLKIYKTALDFVLQEQDLKNIAITGPYSAGKSSTIETFEEISKKKFLHISLAHFESANGEVSSDTKDKKDFHNIDAVLEGKILNQLIHQISPSDIPQTQFKVKRKVSIITKTKMIISSILLTVLFALILYIKNFKNWGEFVGKLSPPWLKSVLMFTTKSSTIVIGGIVCACIASYLIYSLIKLQYNRNMIKKIKVQGNEIEILSDTTESYFDKYLNEVLYLFENAKVDAIVFEDMDRFDDNKIFEKLREINILINKKSNKIIRFFYLLRDDIFVSKDRTKFFDFIIPIVPVIDGSNSYDQFINLFKKGNIYDSFNKEFLEGLSLYIDDMRILKNIYNEYVIYYDRIQSTELNRNKLLAVITYKNIFPRDFSELQLGRGFVHTIFQNKSQYFSDQILQFKNEYQNIQSQIESAKNEIFNEVEELEVLFFKPSGLLRVNGRLEYQFQSRREFLKELKSSPDNVQELRGNGYYSYDVRAEFDKLSNNTDFKKRKRLIETKPILNELSLQSNELLNKISLLEGKKLQEIITKENIDSIFRASQTNEIGIKSDFNEVKSSSYFTLIKYLIRNGYIDETYPDYMTYFYEHSLSRADKIFLRSVTDEIPKDFLYELKDPALVVSRLRDTDYDNEEILNFSLLSHLLIKENENIGRFITQLKVKNRVDFIHQFWVMGKEKERFVFELNQRWPNVLQIILSSILFTVNQKQQYVLDTIYFSPEEDLIVMNDDNFLNSYISGNENFLHIYEPNVPLIINRLLLLGVKFLDINSEKANLSLFKSIYEADLYQLNFKMIKLIIEKLYEVPTDDIEHKLYTIILSKSDERLVSYVKSHIDHLMTVILENSDEKLFDDEPVVVAILNDTDISFDNKSQYVYYSRTLVDSLDAVTDLDIWKDILRLRKVKYTEFNILSYYIVFGLDNILIDFINSDSIGFMITYEKIQEKYNPDDAVQLYGDIISCNELIDAKFEMFIRGFGRHYEKFEYEGIIPSHISVLIKYKVIFMNQENLLYMRANYSDNLIDFICENIIRYTDEVINEEIFDFLELLEVLRSNVEDSSKLKLLSFTQNSISVNSNKFSEEIKEHILQHNFNVEDVPYLLNIFKSVGARLKTIILTLLTQHIDIVLSKQHIVSYDILINLLRTDELTAVKKFDLLLEQLINLNEKQVIGALELLGMEDAVGVFKGRRPKFEVNDRNEKMLSIFKTRGWITTFEVDKKEGSFYRANGRYSQHLQ
ncbi:hypothetical protein [Paenibacillus glycanilyticus]|uniref:YobI-like P-loop NTPase domain-containing protein n=1 Tax=Paenibacillus glycanilyticus TaxID=126569 RepID=A0ABQ6GQW5_9BACL|nr:hypothetical protein [Paenibacillus glycanilyticus]GLX71422.1 hypothetical protein MU1_57720 [Paenibacillus glycanilyticus]